MPNFGYRASRFKGQSVRSMYRTLLPLIVAKPIENKEPCPLIVYSYSGIKDLPEQIASIRSFLIHVGIPEKFVVISDGSHTEKEKGLLRQVHHCVDVESWQSLIIQSLPEIIVNYAYHHPEHHAMGKRLAVFMSLSINRPTLYIDSDVLFFPGAKCLTEIVKLDNTNPMYLLDCSPSLDPRILREDDETREPVNAGCFILRENLDWTIPLQRLNQLLELPVFHTDQTLIHLAIRQSNGKFFDPEKFILKLDDTFVYEDKYANPTIALRHYVSPVRHKFWSQVQF